MLIVKWLIFAMMASKCITSSLKSLEKYGVSVYDTLLASRLGFEIKQTSDSISAEAGLILQENERDGAIELAWGRNSNIKEVPFRIDFTSAAARQRGKQSKSELICRAIGSKTSHVVDLTAGLGRDSFILACSGFHVCMLERNPVLFCLLSDAIKRLHKVDSTLAERMNLIELDSRKVLSLGEIGIDFVESESVAVYLDPMYEANTVGRRSNVKKETTMLHRLVKDENGLEDNPLLFSTAERLSKSRIVVKRPLKANPLADTTPHSAVEGSTQRFDIYFKNRVILGM